MRFTSSSLLSHSSPVGVGTSSSVFCGEVDKTESFGSSVVKFKDEQKEQNFCLLPVPPLTRMRLETPSASQRIPFNLLLPPFRLYLKKKKNFVKAQRIVFLAQKKTSHIHPNFLRSIVWSIKCTKYS